jgi:hypothetical protein
MFHRNNSTGKSFQNYEPDEPIMKIDFDLLPDNSRIWIYQSDRSFSSDEKDLIQQMADNFVTEWTAHGKDLKAGACILYDQFLILSVNEKINGASGCSIDASVRFIREIENTYRIILTDRSKIAYLKDGKVALTEFPRIKKEIENQTITGDTLIFNNLVQTIGALKDQWLIPARDSWMKKYLKINTEKTHE